MKKEELLKGLTQEQVEKARACHNNEELLALAKEEGIELNDEQLSAISGGGCSSPDFQGAVCPGCYGTDIDARYDEAMNNSRGGYHCTCRSCGATFDVGC